jgi:DNA ligase-1
MKFKNLLNDLRNTTKPTEKQAVLLRYDSRQLRELLRYTYDPFILFNVNILAKDVPAPADHDLGEIFDDVTTLMNFCQNSKSPKQNRERVNKLLGQLNAGSQELLMLTLNKNWKAGVSAKTIEKVFPGLISQFNVQLAETYDPNKASHKRNAYGLSYKLDGL